MEMKEDMVMMKNGTMMMVKNGEMTTMEDMKGNIENKTDDR